MYLEPLNEGPHHIFSMKDSMKLSHHSPPNPFLSESVYDIEINKVYVQTLTAEIHKLCTYCH